MWIIQQMFGEASCIHNVAFSDCTSIAERSIWFKAIDCPHISAVDNSHDVNISKKHKEGITITPIGSLYQKVRPTKYKLDKYLGKFYISISFRDKESPN